MFAEAKERFAVHLRPEEVVEALSTPSCELSLTEVDPLLRQLTEWGNLTSSPDTADVTTVEDFYRERRQYQLSRAGEAAERAIRMYEERDDGLRSMPHYPSDVGPQPRQELEHARSQLP